MRVLSITSTSRFNPIFKVVKSRGTEPKFNKLILVLNPNSQGGAAGKNWKCTCLKIKRYLPNPHHIVLTKKADDGTNLTRKLLEQGYSNIAAVGGDCTINEVANGFFKIKFLDNGLNAVRIRTMRVVETEHQN